MTKTRWIFILTLFSNGFTQKMLDSFAENIPNLGSWTIILNESVQSKYTKQLGQNRVTSVLLNLFWLDCLALSFDVLSIFMHAQNAGWMILQKTLKVGNIPMLFLWKITFCTSVLLNQAKFEKRVLRLKQDRLILSKQPLRNPLPFQVQQRAIQTRISHSNESYQLAPILSLQCSTDSHNLSRNTLVNMQRKI